MGIFDYKYLSAAQLKGFDNYKYSCIDNSPLAVYISHPFWNWLVEYYPRWLAPNVLTLGGWILVMGCFLIETFMDYQLSRNSAGSTNPIPDWFWALAAICTFTGHFMDGTDGKQARRIGASGPTGEMFDHGLDSWSTVPFTITIFSVFGQGEFSVPMLRLLCILITVQVVFIATHWEKYNTGVLFLSWGYDASQYGLTIVYLWTYFMGYNHFHSYVFSTFTVAKLLEIGFYVTCVLSVGMTLYNVKAASAKGTLKTSSWWEMVRPIVSSLVLFAVSIWWGAHSPSLLVAHPRLFFFTMGTIFSNIACRLIISQMSSSRAELLNNLLLLFVGTAALSTNAPSMELPLFFILSAVVLGAHLHYGACIVRQMCDHFKIYAFNVSYLDDKEKQK